MIDVPFVAAVRVAAVRVAAVRVAAVRVAAVRLAAVRLVAARWLCSLLFVTGAMVACHEPYSNEDLRFLYDGVPRDIEIAVPLEDGRSTGVGEPGGPPPAGTAQFYGDARQAADELNRDILGLIAWVDMIVAEPPSTRTEDQRVWGPFPGGEGVQLGLIAERVQTSTVFRGTSTSTAVEVDSIFSYSLILSLQNAAEPAVLMAGQQIADPGDTGAQGRALIDLDVARLLDPAQSGGGQVLVGYDDRFDQLTLELALGALYLGQAPTASWRHTQDAAGAGSFLFFLLENVDPVTENLELWAVAARWLDDGRGRADVWIAGGDLALPLVASECWAADFTRTYLLSNIPDPAYLPSGSLADCAPQLRVSQFPE